MMPSTTHENGPRGRATGGERAHIPRIAQNAFSYSERVNPESMTPTPPRDRSLTKQLAIQGGLRRMVQPPRHAERFKSTLLWAAVVAGITLALVA
jgi:hypothetical protein